MVTPDNIYQSILYSLSKIPTPHLEEVQQYLHKFQEELQQKKQNRQNVLSFAGSWNDMSEVDFQDYLEAAKNGLKV